MDHRFVAPGKPPGLHVDGYVMPSKMLSRDMMNQSNIVCADTNSVFASDLAGDVDGLHVQLRHSPWTCKSTDPLI
jgi:hypothetical protein